VTAILLSIGTVERTREGVVEQVPDLQIPVEHALDNTGPGIWVASWSAHALVVQDLGVIGGRRLWLGSGTRAIMAGLAHLGANVMRTDQLSPTRITALRDAGATGIQQRSDGAVIAIVPPATLNGSRGYDVAIAPIRTARGEADADQYRPVRLRSDEDAAWGDAEPLDGGGR
jgi:hypothetical protein